MNNCEAIDTILVPPEGAVPLWGVPGSLSRILIQVSGQLR